jgi:hypothetical protein
VVEVRAIGAVLLAAWGGVFVAFALVADNVVLMAVGLALIVFATLLNLPRLE